MTPIVADTYPTSQNCGRQIRDTGSNLHIIIQWFWSNSNFSKGRKNAVLVETNGQKVTLFKTQ